MSELAYQFKLSEDLIPQEPSVFAKEEGACLRFLGTVRESEQGKRIVGIEYSAYESMAIKELERLCHDFQEAGHADHRVFIQHRLGFVSAREPSIVIDVFTKHSAEGFELCQKYLAAIKKRVPIWKKPCFED